MNKFKNIYRILDFIPIMSISILDIPFYDLSNLNRYISNDDIDEKSDEYIIEKINQGYSYPEDFIYQAIKKDKLEIYKLLISKRDYNFEDGHNVSIAIENGSINILDYEYKNGFWLNESILQEAVIGGSLKIVKYILSVLGKYTSSEITSNAVCNDKIDILLELAKYGLVLDENTIVGSALYGKLDILLLFYSLGYTLEEAIPVFFTLNENIKINMSKFYHYINLPGKCQTISREETCKVCHIFEIGKLWELESEEYDNWIQFLPKELIVDLEELILK